MPCKEVQTAFQPTTPLNPWVYWALLAVPNICPIHPVQYMRNSQPTPRRALWGKRGARAGPWGQFPRALNRGPPKLVSPFPPRFPPFAPVFPPVWILEFIWHGYYGALCLASAVPVSQRRGRHLSRPESPLCPQLQRSPLRVACLQCVCSAPVSPEAATHWHCAASYPPPQHHCVLARVPCVVTLVPCVMPLVPGVVPLAPCVAPLVPCVQYP